MTFCVAFTSTRELVPQSGSFKYDTQYNCAPLSTLTLDPPLCTNVTMCLLVCEFDSSIVQHGIQTQLKFALLTKCVYIRKAYT